MILPGVGDPLDLDAGGQPIVKNRVYEYHYDASGNQTEIVDPYGHTTQFTFDPAGRQTSRTLPLAEGRITFIRRVSFTGTVAVLSQSFRVGNGRLLGAIHVADTPRPEAAEAISQLRSMGLRTVLLTGDVAAVANAVGRELGVEEVAAELLPDDKVARIEALLARGKRAAMIGDGINDAPALTAASVGVATGSGTDVARESADVVLLGSDLLKFVETLKIARRCRRIIWSNFIGTLTVDSIGVGLAAFGFLNPLLAASIHVSSELAFSGGWVKPANTENRMGLAVSCRPT